MESFPSTKLQKKFVKFFKRKKESKVPSGGIFFLQNLTKADSFLYFSSFGQQLKKGSTFLFLSSLFGAPAPGIWQAMAISCGRWFCSSLRFKEFHAISCSILRVFFCFWGWLGGVVSGIHVFDCCRTSKRTDWTAVKSGKGHKGTNFILSVCDFVHVSLSPISSHADRFYSLWNSLSL